MRVLNLIKARDFQGKKGTFTLFSGFCYVIDSGNVDHKTSYIVMRKLGRSLRDIAQERKKTFTLKTICLIGI